jgi:hypothetical protein
MVGSASLAKAQFPKALVFGNFTVANPNNNDFKKYYDNGQGLELGAGIGLGRVLFTGSTGFINYNATTTNTTYGNLKVIPVKLGARVYLVGKLFVNGNVGMAFQSYEKNKTTSNNFLYEVGAGVKLIRLIEVGVAYTGWQTPGLNVNANALLFKAGFSVKL